MIFQYRSDRIFRSCVHVYNPVRAVNADTWDSTSCNLERLLTEVTPCPEVLTPTDRGDHCLNLSDLEPVFGWGTKCVDAIDNSVNPNPMA
jgi:hypothetical protein